MSITSAACLQMPRNYSTILPFHINSGFTCCVLREWGVIICSERMSSSLPSTSDEVEDCQPIKVQHKFRKGVLNEPLEGCHHQPRLRTSKMLSIVSTMYRRMEEKHALQMITLHPPRICCLSCKGKLSLVPTVSASGNEYL